MTSSYDERVGQVLTGTMHQDASIRGESERALAQLFFEPGVVLQKYIEKHWSASSDQFEDPVVPREIRHAVREKIILGIGAPEEKIRNASAYATALIARYDWPDDYPTFIPALAGILMVGQPDGISGATSVLLEFFTQDLSPEHLVPVASALLPPLLNILRNDSGSHAAAPRSRAVKVFEEVVKMLDTMREEHPEVVKQALDSIGKTWLKELEGIVSGDLAEDAMREWETLTLRKDIFRCLELFEANFSRFISPFRPAFITLATRNLVSLVPVLKTYSITSGPSRLPIPTSSSAASDPVTPDKVAVDIFDYLQPATRGKNARDLLVQPSKTGADDVDATELLETILVAVVTSTQIPAQLVDDWTDDPSEFIIDDDESSPDNYLRAAAHDLVGSLIDVFPRPVGTVLQGILTNATSESITAHGSGNPDWWKPLEAALAMLGAMADDIRALLEEDEKHSRNPTVNFSVLFERILPDILQQADAPFLQGRAFVFVSSFASLLPPTLAGHYIDAAVSVLQSSDVSTTVKVSAIQAVKNFCRHIDVDLMRPRSASILSFLHPLLPSLEQESLYLTLETVRAVIALDKGILDAGAAAQLTQTVFPIWAKYSDDPVLAAITEELFESLSTTPDPEVVHSIIHTISPLLVNAISSSHSSETVHIPAEAVQLANSLIRCRGGPLEEELIGTVTVAIMDLLKVTDDMNVIQHGMVHLTQVVRKDCDKLIQLHDVEGTNGIATIFQLLARFLSPEFSESGGLFIGELIMHLFRKAGSVMGPVLPDLLRAIVQRLTTAKMASFIQSLVLPFAYLFSTEYTQTTIDLLASFPVTMPSQSISKTGLEVVLGAWCDTADTILGSWNIRVSDLGMAKLFSLPLGVLRGVSVKGDLIISSKNKNTIMTRSRTKITPNEYTSIPFPLKAFKLLLKDLQNVKHTGVGSKKVSTGTDSTGTGLGIEDDDGDEDWEEDDPLGEIAAATGEFDFLSSWLDEGHADENDAQDDDEDLKADPIAQIDLAEHLTAVLRHCYTGNENGMHEMIAGLDEVEKGILRGVLTL